MDFKGKAVGQIIQPHITPTDPSRRKLPRTTVYNRKLNKSKLLCTIQNNEKIRVETEQHHQCPDSPLRYSFSPKKPKVKGAFPPISTLKRYYQTTSKNPKRSHTFDFGESSSVNIQRGRNKRNKSIRNGKRRTKSLNLGISVEGFRSVFEPLDWNQRPNFVVSTRSGTTYENPEYKSKFDLECEKKLEPLLIRKMYESLKDAREKEITKHEQRQRILYRFRLQRLNNTFFMNETGQLLSKPIIFTPDAMNPFQPEKNEIEYHLSNGVSKRLQELCLPRVRLDIPLPEDINVDSPIIQKLMHEIKRVPSLRYKYDWRTLYSTALNDAAVVVADDPAFDDTLELQPPPHLNQAQPSSSAIKQDQLDDTLELLNNVGAKTDRKHLNSVSEPKLSGNISNNNNNSNNQASSNTTTGRSYLNSFKSSSKGHPNYYHNNNSSDILMMNNNVQSNGQWKQPDEISENSTISADSLNSGKVKQTIQEMEQSHRIRNQRIAMSASSRCQSRRRRSQRLSFRKQAKKECLEDLDHFEQNILKELKKKKQSRRTRQKR